MADDKRDGDDLFEDLDKFFAPIKDVDWDEPASAGAREVSSEEHVAVRSEAPDTAPPEPGPADHGPAEPDDHDEDESWYDTSVIEAIDSIDEEPVEEIVDVVEPEETPLPEPHPGQADLFAEGEEPKAVDTDTAEWPVVGDDHLEDEGEEAPVLLAEEEAQEVDAPSEEALEAAAQHFAGSVGEEHDAVPMDEDEFAQPVVVGAELIDDEGPRGVEEDLLSDLRGSEDATHTVMVGSEGLGGPSWQEPASVEVGADLESRRGPDAGERDVPAAFLTGVLLAGLALGTILISKGLFAVLATLVVLYAQGEFFSVLAKQHKQPATAVGLITGALIMGGAYYHGEAGVLSMFVLGVAATLLWFMAVPATHRKDTVANIGLTLVNVAWIPVLASYLLIMLDQPDGKSLVISVIGLTFVFDTFAFLGGSIMGGQFFQRPLAPSVSPKKSIEGLIIATLVTVIVSVALVTSFVTPFEDMRIETLVLGLVVAAAATFGDLAESLIKRDLGLKDMGSVLPGHGGVLDRIDSLLFVAPAAFLFFRVVFA